MRSSAHMREVELLPVSHLLPFPKLLLQRGSCQRSEPKLAEANLSRQNLATQAIRRKAACTASFASLKCALELLRQLDHVIAGNVGTRPQTKAQGKQGQHKWSNHDVVLACCSHNALLTGDARA